MGSMIGNPDYRFKQTVRRGLTALAAVAALGAMVVAAAPAARATVFSVVLGAGATKDGSASLGASFAGTQLSFDTSTDKLTIDLLNGGLGTIDTFSLTLSSLVTSATPSTVAANWSASGAPAFNDEPHDGFTKTPGLNPFDIGVTANPPPSKNGLDSGESASFVFTLAGDFSGVSSFFDIIDPFDEQDGNLFNVFWVGHVIQLDNGACTDGKTTCASVWIGGVVRDSVPEPLTLALFGSGLLGLGLARRRRRTAA